MSPSATDQLLPQKGNQSTNRTRPPAGAQRFANRAESRTQRRLRQSKRQLRLASN
jgi:hypothetical protein